MKMTQSNRMYKVISLVGILLLGFVTVQAQDVKPEDTEVWEPVPPVVTPGVQQGIQGEDAEPPSDAIVLFNGKDLSEWQKPQFKGEPTTADGVEKMLKKWDPDFKHEEAQWNVSNGHMVVNPGTGAIETKREFDNFQLHIEWMAPVDEGKSGQGYSNSGIFLMSLYEIQVLNSYENETYPNGQAGSIYKQHIPLVNASRPPGEWQAYDIVFSAPVFDENGTLQSPARVTAFHNGILILNDVELRGPTVYIDEPRYVAHPEQMPLRLQDHGDLVRFRNIWIRPLELDK